MLSRKVLTPKRNKMNNIHSRATKDLQELMHSTDRGFGKLDQDRIVKLFEKVIRRERKDALRKRPDDCCITWSKYYDHDGLC